MIKVALELMKKVFTMKFPWNLWVMILVGVNIVGGLVYFAVPEGMFSVVAIVASFVVMCIVYKRFGFVRLLGLGHVVFWTPLCLWLFLKLSRGHYESDSNLKAWVLTLLTVNTLSLVIDYVDVIRFFRGDQKVLS